MTNDKCQTFGGCHGFSAVCKSVPLANKAPNPVHALVACSTDLNEYIQIRGTQMVHSPPSPWNSSGGHQVNARLLSIEPQREMKPRQSMWTWLRTDSSPVHSYRPMPPGTT